MTHKEKCKKMKSIRKTIADKLGVDLHQRKCTYQGDCKGTCPRCEQEEKTLNKILLKNSAAVAGLAMTAISITGCGSVEDLTTEHRANDPSVLSTTEKKPDSTEPLDGDILEGDTIADTQETTTETTEILDGVVEIEGLETDPDCTVTLTTEQNTVTLTTEERLTGDEYIPTTENIEVGTTADTTEELIELDGDIAFYYSDEEIINACQKYSKADVAFITENNGDIATVECCLFLNELDPETGESRKETIAQFSVDRTTGDAACNTETTFNIYDYLGDE